MGFSASLCFIPKLGIRVSGAQYTVKGSYVLQKKGASLLSMQGPQGPQSLQSNAAFTVLARMYVYGSPNYDGLQPVVEDTLSVSFAEIPQDPLGAIYDALKTTVRRDCPDAVFVDN